MTLAMQDVIVSTKDSNPLLHSISLEIAQGKTLVLLGASGSGKTLSLSVLQGIIPANLNLTSGRVLLNGELLDPINARGRIFASIMQNPRTCFNPLFSMKSHIKETLHAVKKPYRKEVVESTLNEAGLDPTILNRYSFELSGGMLQRVMIVIALLAEAKFILADEPTSDLDELNQQRILDILDSVRVSRNIGIFLITHDLSIAIQRAHKILIIHNGKIQDSIEPIHFDAKELRKLLIDKLLSRE
ncbi:ATP-binding cassette domain-containing protein [Helicobacter muridarum]|uniref:ATP-binding cassette domain-containing protein n=1 Tax=Helicobacter muridarum TaxID=216 RepID=A0A099TYE5_9HELI|nr:ATP-binding cassette domain-containing protein [Helicobacter muridarum]TLE00148.1 ATP-binding cassette domain-containing protein [Helicobacter muridarum]STQ87046.1 nickel ABC transporter permease protein [Helicobacter muridarum]